VFVELWDEHLPGFHRKAFKQAQKKEFQRDMLWKAALTAETNASESSNVKRKADAGNKRPARVGAKKSKRGKRS